MTTITKAQARKIQQVALLTATSRNRSLVNMMTEAAPKAAMKDKRLNRQTSEHAPIVRLTDLQKSAGDTVDMQVVHKLSKRPTMGDRKIAGRGESLDLSSFELSIDQGRHQVDAGGKMSQQRTVHDLQKTARTMLGTYFNDLDDQIATVHFCGARGGYMASDTILPLANHDEYAELMVNDVLPPTYDRHFFGGDATKFEALDSSDLFTLEKVDDLGLAIEEMANPIQPIRYKEDMDAGNEPFYLLNVTPRQWNDWKQTTTYKDWQQITANAMSRSRGFNHPVFRGETAMWGNILVRKYGGMPIRFDTGATVKVCANDNTATIGEVTAAARIDRAFLVGGQALASAWGKTQNGQQFSIHEEPADAGNRKEITIAWMKGMKKIRLADKSGRVNDHGVMVLDTAISVAN
ncbi:N4-gp56 family major capsid protein [Vibrio salinus]|uniref:N4-gp56 family major capsid protein n=1 Tax=Vibrio salinus TaxID=2899784 RepID=UPI001E64BD00|nr:N4-gp56 family major capsid protein [Vibrio salinus]MCE0495770.1 N4-gp56 family major capsid protein [Vibrio salinus]